MCYQRSLFGPDRDPARTRMADDKRQLFRSLGLLSSVGISMVAATCIGLFIGITLDEWLGHQAVDDHHLARASASPPGSATSTS